jgi:uncharacterized protein YeaO (DUF488 family)
MAYPLQTKRIYEPKAASDGQRVLVDRIWPRGVSKTAAALDLWLKDVAPSTELRNWFAHQPERWAEFQRRYFLELGTSAAIAELRALTQAGPVTLLYAARDTDHNEAVALVEFLKV